MLEACWDFLEKLEACRGQLGLYKTFLSPTDDPVDYPYLTYNNVLVWKALQVSAGVLERLGQREKAEEVRSESTALHRRIQELCITAGPLGPMYAWACLLYTSRCV